MQIEEVEAQMAEMHQSSAVLAEAESSVRQQVSGLQVAISNLRTQVALNFLNPYAKLSILKRQTLYAQSRMHRCYGPFWNAV